MAKKKKFKKNYVCLTVKFLHGQTGFWKARYDTSKNIIIFIVCRVIRDKPYEYLRTRRRSPLCTNLLSLTNPSLPCLLNTVTQVRETSVYYILKEVGEGRGN